jgi:hypothetical protein
MTHPKNAQDKRMTASMDWKARMAKAKEDRPDQVGKQLIIEKVVEYDPEIDRLTNATRWHNAWNLRVADPEITLLVERAVAYYKAKEKGSSNRLNRHKLKTVQ